MFSHTINTNVAFSILNLNIDLVASKFDTEKLYFCVDIFISKHETFCFLRYIAFGKTVAQLNVYTRKRAVLSEEPIWSISGDQGDRWRPAAVTISEYEDFQVCGF